MSRRAAVVIVAASGLAACGRIGFDDREPTADADPLRPAAIEQVVVGGRSSCVLRHDGGVWCWGMAAGGRLGNGTLGIDALLPVPSAITSGAVELFANDAGTCARMATGHLECWGDNNVGAFGLGDDSPRPTPTEVPGITDFDHVALATNAMCIVIAGGVRCADSQFQLGTGETADRATFAPVPGLTTVKQVTGGNYFYCALLLDGSTRCWGDNSFGQLGDGTMAYGATPVVGPSGPFTQIAAGDNFACGVTPTRTVECWGDNQHHQLGNDALVTGGFGPVAGIDDVQVLEAAAAGACALRGDHTVWCWGDGEFGQLGDGDSTSRAQPEPVDLRPDTEQLTSRTDLHACVLDGDRVVRCWGNNDGGALGIGTSDSDIHATPTVVLGLP